MSGGWQLDRIPETYLFIDGGHLRALANEMLGRTFSSPNVVIDFGRIRNTIQCGKVFYYDCLDEQREREEVAAYAERSKAQREQFERIRSLPGYHVIEGTLARRRQKEVDVALAVDMLTHAFNKNLAWAHLIAGDLDFRPLVQALVRLGVYVTVWSRRTASAKQLQWAADESRDITIETLFNWAIDEFRNKHQLPTIGAGHRPLVNPQILKTARFRGGVAVLYRQSDGSHLVQVNNIPGVDPWHFIHREQNVLEHYFAFKYEAVEWQTTRSEA